MNVILKLTCLASRFSWKDKVTATLALTMLLTSCNDPAIIDTPESPEPVKVDTIFSEVSTFADFEKFIESIPNTEPDLIRNFYYAYIMQNIGIRNDGKDYEILDLSGMYAHNRKKDIYINWLGEDEEGGGDGDGDKLRKSFYPAADSLYITPARWNNWEKPALSKNPNDDNKNWWTDAEYANGFDIYSNIMKIIGQGVDGNFILPNSGAVVSEIDNIEDYFKSGNTLILDLAGDLGADEENKSAINRLIDVLVALNKDPAKGEVKGALRIYADKYVHFDKSIISRLIATKGVFINSDGSIVIPGIGLEDIPLVKQIVAADVQLVTDKGRNFETLEHGVAALENEFTEEIKDFPTKIAKHRKLKPNQFPGQYVLKTDDWPADVVTEETIVRIGQKAVNGTAAYPNPDFIVKDNDGNLADLAFKEARTSNGVDDNVSNGYLHRFAAIQQMRKNDPGIVNNKWKFASFRVRNQVAGNIPIEFLRDDKSTIKFVGKDPVSNDNANGTPITAVAMQSLVLYDIVTPYDSNGNEGQFSFDMAKYCLEVPDSLFQWLPGQDGYDYRLGLLMFIKINAKATLTNLPNFGESFSTYYISESKASDMGIISRKVPFPAIMMIPEQMQITY